MAIETRRAHHATGLCTSALVRAPVFRISYCIGLCLLQEHVPARCNCKCMLVCARGVNGGECVERRITWKKVQKVKFLKSSKYRVIEWFMHCRIRRIWGCPYLWPLAMGMRVLFAVCSIMVPTKTSSTRHETLHGILFDCLHFAWKSLSWDLDPFVGLHRGTVLKVG